MKNYNTGKIRCFEKMFRWEPGWETLLINRDTALKYIFTWLDQMKIPQKILFIFVNRKYVLYFLRDIFCVLTAYRLFLNLKYSSFDIQIYVQALVENAVQEIVRF